MIIRGIYQALRGGDWRDEFNLGQTGLALSFGALLLNVPLGILIVNAVVRFNSKGAATPDYANIVQSVLGLSLIFPVIAFVLSLVFQKRDHLQDWLIVRNWTHIVMVALFAAMAGLYLAGLIPFIVVYMTGLGLYLGTLAVDIRLAARIGGFNWMGAIFTAILIATAIIAALLAIVSRSLG